MRKQGIIKNIDYCSRSSIQFCMKGIVECKVAVKQDCS